MKSSISFPADPDSQPMMDILTDLDIDQRQAYNAVQGVQNMAGRNVIAAVDSKFAETNANIQVMAEETNAKFTEMNAKIDTLFGRLRVFAWAMGLLVAFLGMIVTVLVAVVLYALPSDPAPADQPVRTPVAEEPVDDESLAAAAPDDDREVDPKAGPE